MKKQRKKLLCPDCGSKLEWKGQQGSHSGATRYYCNNPDCLMIFVEHNYVRGRNYRIIATRVIREARAKSTTR